MELKFEFYITTTQSTTINLDDALIISKPLGKWLNFWGERAFYNQHNTHTQKENNNNNDLLKVKWSFTNYIMKTHSFSIVNQIVDYFNGFACTNCYTKASKLWTEQKRTETRRSEWTQWIAFLCHRHHYYHQHHHRYTCSSSSVKSHIKFELDLLKYWEWISSSNRLYFWRIKHKMQRKRKTQTPSSNKSNNYYKK